MSEPKPTPEPEAEEPPHAPELTIEDLLTWMFNQSRIGEEEEGAEASQQIPPDEQ